MRSVFDTLLKPGRDGEDGEDGGEQDAGAVAHEQHLQRGPCPQRNGAVFDLVEHGGDGVVEGRKQQRVIEEAAVGLPRDSEKEDDRSLANLKDLTEHDAGQRP
jgi:hypothetical protein